MRSVMCGHTAGWSPSLRESTVGSTTCRLPLRPTWIVKARHRSAWRLTCKIGHVDDAGIVGRSHEGEWWLPGAPDHKVAGRLVVSEEGRTTLHLIGALGVGTRPFREPDDEALRVIHGLVGTQGFTLDRCFQTHLSGMYSAGSNRQEIHVHRVLAGPQTLIVEPFNAHEIAARMDGFGFWVGRTGLTSDEGVHEDTKRAWIVHRLDHLPDEKVLLTDGGELSIHHVWADTGNMQSGRAFEQDFSVILGWNEAHHVDELLGRLGLLQDLVTVAVGRPAAYLRVLVKDRQPPEGRTTAPFFDMVANWTVRALTGARPVTYADVRFTLGEMGGLPSLVQWMEVADKNRSMLARVMATSYSRQMYVSDQVLNCAAAIEAYDKQRNGSLPLTPGHREVTFRERVERCANLAGPEFLSLIGDAEAWGNTLKRHRVNVAHHLERGEDATADVLSVADAARWMFLLCLFQDCRFPSVVFKKCAASNEWTWLRHRLRASGVVSLDEPTRS